MTAINHALTGSLIAFVIINPVAAIILALLSHFMLDSFPHFGGIKLKSDLFKWMLIVDAALCFLLVLLLAIFQPDHWLLAAICAFVAASPDFAQINKYLKINRGERWTPGLLNRFSSKIQWSETPKGAYIEAAWFLIMGYLVVLYI